jgi:hypothetical protein
MKRSEFALVSFLAGIACFVNLLGMEKAILAVIFGTLAFKQLEKEPEKSGKWMAYAGTALGIAYLITIVVILIIKGPEILSYFRGISSR